MLSLRPKRMVGGSQYQNKLTRCRLDQTEFPCPATIQNIHMRAARIAENKKLSMGHFQLQNRFVDKHRLDLISFRPNNAVLRMLVFFHWFWMKHMFVEMFNHILARTVFAHQSRLIFPHLARNLVAYLID